MMEVVMVSKMGRQSEHLMASMMVLVMASRMGSMLVHLMALSTAQHLALVLGRHSVIPLVYLMEA
jgi:hypothetical protein